MPGNARQAFPAKLRRERREGRTGEEGGRRKGTETETIPPYNTGHSGRVESVAYLPLRNSLLARFARDITQSRFIRARQRRGAVVRTVGRVFNPAGRAGGGVDERDRCAARTDDENHLRRGSG